MKFVLIMLRPRQWVKNLVCVAPLIGSSQLFNLEMSIRAISIAILFTLMASGVYIFNDLIDKKYDRRHPTKKFRPIASGQINIQSASVIGAILVLVSLVATYEMNRTVFMLFILYLSINFCYSAYLKMVPVVDVICIAIGFVIRFLVGAYFIEVVPSAWAILVTFFLALFIGFNKRRAEQFTFGESEKKETTSRIVLSKYTTEHLEQLVNCSTLMIILSYSLFATMSGKNSALILTLPPVFYGVMRYNLLVVSGKTGEQPEKILLEDWRMWLTVLIWFVSTIVILYLDLDLFSTVQEIGL